MTDKRQELATRPEGGAILGWTPEQVDIIKKSICRGASDDELRFFLAVCQRTQLDPFTRQVHAVPRRQKNPRTGEYENVMVFQVGIDGYRSIAARTDQYAGSDDPLYDVEDAPHPNRATVTVYRMVNNQRIPFTATARWKEFVQIDKEGKPGGKWKDMPYHMLAKCAEGLALRKAFPQELSGLYTDAELSKGGEEIHDAEAVQIPRRKSLPAPASGSSPHEPPTEPDLSTMKKRIWVLIRERMPEIADDEEARHQWMKKHVGKTSSKDLTIEDCKVLIQILKEMPIPDPAS